MGIKDILQKFRESRDERKRMMAIMDNQRRIENTLENREKSANERELLRYLKEEREAEIKTQLEMTRKLKSIDISNNNNPIKIKNITSHSEWEVLKSHNIFGGKQSNIISKDFSGNNILKNN